MTTLIVILIIIALPLVGALFLSNDYAITRETTIAKPVQTVFDYIRYTNNHRHFNKWWMMDPGMEIGYRGQDGNTGFIASWESTMKRGPGAGEQETMEIVEGKKLEYEIRFLKPFVSTTLSTIKTGAVAGDSTKVTWTFSGKRNYSMKLFHFLFRVPNMLGKELQESQTNLKTILEK